MNGLFGEHNMAFFADFDSSDALEMFDSRRSNTFLEPERLLMIAVLEDAIACYQRYAHARERKLQRLFAEAESWFMEEEGDWFFSFANVCEILGLSPGFIRAGLLRWKEGQAGEKSRGKIYRLKAGRGRAKRVIVTAS